MSKQFSVKGRFSAMPKTSTTLEFLAISIPKYKPTFSKKGRYGFDPQPTSSTFKPLCTLTEVLAIFLMWENRKLRIKYRVFAIEMLVSLRSPIEQSSLLVSS